MDKEYNKNYEIFFGYKLKFLNLNEINKTN